MKIVNGTTETIQFTIGYAGTADCGTIAPEEQASFPGYDNQANVYLNLSIPKTGTRMDVSVSQP
jgi:hypothetical protein